MSVQFIMNASIYAVKPKGKSRQPKRKQALSPIGGRKSASELTTKLLDGRKRKCLHYQVSQHGFKTKVSGETIKLGDERTYTPAMLAAKAEKPRKNAKKKEPRIHKARKAGTKHAKGLRHG
ncbi:hypothetical protein [Salmonella phage 7-11]|uniref:Uncharacterized protein n=1 Tax=Salmonella phage 7-11 TaxID=1054968 RepID=G0X582_9CAUD|nr:hypothetical protein SaPh711_gp149 [Salmonella phage 7-11]AEK82064.1 hypothetical protein [Salmonella phage 7-11]